MNDLNGSYKVDMASEIDLPEERLAEALNSLQGCRVTPGACKFIMGYIDNEVAVHAKTEISQTLGDVIALLIQPTKNLRDKVFGLACSFNLTMSVNGVRSMAEMARKRGCHRALLSHYKRVFDKVLGSSALAFGKSPEACVKYHDARVKVVDRTRKINHPALPRLESPSSRSQNSI